MDWLNYILTFFALTLFLSVAISSISPKWDYKVKMFYIYSALLVCGMLMIPYGLVVRNEMKTSLLGEYILNPVSKFFNLTWTVVGKENVDRSRAYVVVCNHQSALDIFVGTKVSSCSQTLERSF
jgi:hypothetical protein